MNGSWLQLTVVTCLAFTAGLFLGEWLRPRRIGGLILKFWRKLWTNARHMDRGSVLVIVCALQLVALLAIVGLYTTSKANRACLRDYSAAQAKAQTARSAAVVPLLGSYRDAFKAIDDLIGRKGVTADDLHKALVKGYSRYDQYAEAAKKNPLPPFPENDCG